MRILIISDSHGDTENIVPLKKKAGKIDLVIHCGDGADDLDFIKDYFNCEVWAVHGNMDKYSMISNPKVLNREIEGKKIHIEHGNVYKDLKINSDMLVNVAKDSGYDVILYGHIHEQIILHEDGVWIVNPGSISRPHDGYPSYVILETDGKGGFDFIGERL